MYLTKEHTETYSIYAEIYPTHAGIYTVREEAAPYTPPPRENDELLTRKEAAKYIKFAKGTLAVWDCTKRYDLEPLIVGKRSVRYRKSSLDRFLQQRLIVKKRGH